MYRHPRGRSIGWSANTYIVVPVLSIRDRHQQMLHRGKGHDGKRQRDGRFESRDVGILYNTLSWFELRIVLVVGVNGPSSYVAETCDERRTSWVTGLTSLVRSSIRRLNRIAEIVELMSTPLPICIFLTWKQTTLRRKDCTQ
jgi:hypothetical protein